MTSAEKAFEEFWALYPRKTAKGDARKAFQKHVKAGVPAAVIVAGLRDQMSGLMSRQPEYRPYPATWLNREQWADEPAPPMVPRPGQGTGRNGNRTAVDALRDHLSRLDRGDSLLEPRLLDLKALNS